MSNINYRFIVEILKITYPKGERKTGFTAVFDPEDQVYLPDTDTLNEVLPKLDKEYQKLIESYSIGRTAKTKRNLIDLLDSFLRKISTYVIIKGELLKYIAEDLGLNMNDLKEALKETSWFKEILQCIKREYRRIKKADPVKYAENVCQLVYILGFNNALKMLRKEGIKMGKSTVNGLCRVAGETPKIKKLIRDGKLKLTLAFELPRVRREEREKIAEELCFLSYAEAKKRLRII